MTTIGPVIVATDLSDASRPALVVGGSHAAATGAPLLVCHVVPTVVRYHPLLPSPTENEVTLEVGLLSRVASMSRKRSARC